MSCDPFLIVVRNRKASRDACRHADIGNPIPTTDVRIIPRFAYLQSGSFDTPPKYGDPAQAVVSITAFFPFAAFWGCRPFYFVCLIS
jgi:hypothetical protein